MSNEVGRPLKFKTVKELQDKIDEYFDSCIEPLMDRRIKKESQKKLTKELTTDDYEMIQEKDVKGNLKYKQIEPFTITGLAIYLDCDRETLTNYANRSDELFDTIKRAKNKCHNFAEKHLYTGKNVAGAIFNLKNNYDWVDKQEQDIVIKTPKPLLESIMDNKGEYKSIIAPVRDETPNVDVIPIKRGK